MIFRTSIENAEAAEIASDNTVAKSAKPARYVIGITAESDEERALLEMLLYRSVIVAPVIGNREVAFYFPLESKG